MTNTRVTGCLLAGLAVLFSGCFGGSRPSKAPGSAIWLTPDSAALEAAAGSRLAALGLREVFVDAARIEWQGNPHLRSVAWPDVPRGTATTLVVAGRWTPGDRPPDGLATVLVSELSTLRVAAEQRGAKVVGYHFEVDPGSAIESYTQSLDRLRTLLGSGFFVSAGIDRRSLEDPGARSIAEAVDFVVCRIYGQEPEEAEDPTAWDLEAVESSFRKLEALGRPYLTGAVTLGGATWRGRSGEAKAVTTGLKLGDLVWNRSLELRPGFSLQGIDRQVWEFGARAAVRIGEWELAPRESIRVVRTATPYLEEFRRRLGAWESPHRLGDLYFRLRRDNEGLSLSVDNLADVLAPEPAAPALELSVERYAQSSTRWRLRLHLANRSSEGTDLAFFDSNYVLLQVRGATIGEVDPGAFQRVELFAGGEKGTMRALRETDTVRLYLPLLEERQEVATGEIELRLAQKNPAITTSATFLSPDGHEIVVAPQEWSFEAP